MNHEELLIQLGYSEVDDVARSVGLPPSEVMELASAGFVTMYLMQGKWRMPKDDTERLLGLANSPTLRSKMPLLLREPLYDYRPELADYLCFHGVLDIVCWLIKLRYFPQDDVRRKRYHLCSLFDSFLLKQHPDLHKLNPLVGKECSEDRIAFHLSKGWYNELARSYPLDAGALQIGTSIDSSYGQGRIVAWNIIQSYYAIYEYVNALVFTNTNNLRTEEHRRSTRHFNTCLLPKFSGKLVPYPFNLTSPLGQAIEDLRGGTESWWRYKYAWYPRRPSRSIFDLEQNYLKLLAGDGNLLDLLYNFRVWANYLGINTIIDLQNGFYLSYLYKNLGILCFFYGYFAELMSMAILGEERVLFLLERLGQNYVLQDRHSSRSSYLVPMFLRFRIYHRHGLIHNLPSFLVPMSDDPLDVLK